MGFSGSTSAFGPKAVAGYQREAVLAVEVHAQRGEFSVRNQAISTGSAWFTVGVLAQRKVHTDDAG